MTAFTGTDGAETITPYGLSLTILVSSPDVFPSDEADTIDGQGGDDYIDAGGGNDFVDGGLGSDTIYGGDGDDYILGKTWHVADATDSDTIYGGAGNDVIYGNGGETDTGTPDGDDTIYGESGNDKLFGKLGNDTLFGDDGNDRVAGYHGNDILYGGAGNDFVRGGEGLDILSGGTGKDIFDYDKVSDSSPGPSRDVIADFAGAGTTRMDRIDLSTIDADTGLDGNQAFTFIGSAEFTAPGQVRVLDAGDHTVIEANVTGETGAELAIQVNDDTAAAAIWHATDFIL